MELEGLMRGVAVLEDRGLQVDKLVTDWHMLVWVNKSSLPILFLFRHSLINTAIYDLQVHSQEGQTLHDKNEAFFWFLACSKSLAFKGFHYLYSHINEYIKVGHFYLYACKYLQIRYWRLLVCLFMQGFQNSFNRLLMREAVIPSMAGLRTS